MLASLESFLAVAAPEEHRLGGQDIRAALHLSRPTAPPNKILLLIKNTIAN